jgi:hypothetical protein
MVTVTEINEAMKQKLPRVGLGFESIDVFGTIRCNVHVKCISRKTADKWAQLLGTIFKGVRVSLRPTVWDAVENKGTCLNPTRRQGFLIAVAG